MKIITIILILSLIPLVSAIYPGEIESIDLSDQMEVYTNYTIIGNTSPINVSINNLIATITIPTDYYPGSFEIKFNGYKSDNKVEYVYRDGGSSGSSRTKTETVYLTADNDKYIIKEVPTYINNETIKTLTNDKIIEINKPFYKNIWFYALILSILIIIIFIIRELNG